MGKMFERRSYQQLKNEDEAANPKRVRHEKIAIFGPCEAGKTSLARALAAASLVNPTEPTVGAQYIQTKEMRNTILQIWDLSGAERYEEFWPMYLRASKQVLLVFDDHDEDAFADLEHYINAIQQYAPNACIVLVGIYHGSQEEPGVSQQTIARFVQDHNIQDYHNIVVTDGVDVDKLRNTLIDQSVLAWEKHHPPESIEALKAKELAKMCIEQLRNLASTENEQNVGTIKKLCQLLDKALLSENMDSYFAYHHELIKEQLDELRYAKSSLYSTAYNVVATVIVCCVIVATGFVACYWLQDILQKNYETKGDYLLFSSSGAKQKGKEAIHKAEQSTSPGKKL